MYAMTAAHPTLPIPSYARIRNPANGREVLVRVNDRGPFVAGRIVDLSYAAAFKLDLLRGVAPVELERITFDEIRTGAWRGSSGVRVAAAGAGEGAARGCAGPGARGRRAELAAAGADVPAPAPPAAVEVPTQDVAFAAAPVVPRRRRRAAPQCPPHTAAPAAIATPIMPIAIAAADARPRPGRAPADAARGFWVQLGAFRERDGAETFRRRVGADDESSLARAAAGDLRRRDRSTACRPGPIRAATKPTPSRSARAARWASCRSSSSGDERPRWAAPKRPLRPARRDRAQREGAPVSAGPARPTGRARRSSSPATWSTRPTARCRASRRRASTPRRVASRPPSTRSARDRKTSP